MVYIVTEDDTDHSQLRELFCVEEETSHLGDWGPS